MLGRRLANALGCVAGEPGGRASDACACGMSTWAAAHYRSACLDFDAAVRRLLAGVRTSYGALALLNASPAFSAIRHALRLIVYARGGHQKSEHQHPARLEHGDKPSTAGAV